MSALNRVQTIIVCILFFPALLFSDLPFEITFPKNWDRIEDPTQLPKKVNCLVLGPVKQNFTPSINIASEKTPLSAIEYLKEAKKFHESLPLTKCHYIGELKTRSGPAPAMLIDKFTDWGGVRFLQVMIVEDGLAYVLTGTCLENEFPEFEKTFVDTFCSFKRRNDLKGNDSFVTN